VIDDEEHVEQHVELHLEEEREATMHRGSWDEYFMRIAVEVASRATCDRKHVGAVIVRDKSILATG